MVSKVLLLLGLLALWAGYTYVSKLRTNIAKAKSTNLPYIVARELDLHVPWFIVYFRQHSEALF